jgi:hypothetical protein
MNRRDFLQGAVAAAGLAARPVLAQQAQQTPPPYIFRLSRCPIGTSGYPIISAEMNRCFELAPPNRKYIMRLRPGSYQVDETGLAGARENHARL